jgi:hypothetical protein
MASEYRIEYDRGSKDSRTAGSAPRKMAAGVSTQRPRCAPAVQKRAERDSGRNELITTLYARGTCRVELTSVYCESALGYDHRIARDGGIAEPFEAEVKEISLISPHYS